MKKQGIIKLVTTNARRNYLLSELNIQQRFFPDNLLATEMKRTQILVNKVVYLGLSILEISKIVMCQFWHDYLKPKYGEKANLCCVYTDTFIVYIKARHLRRHCKRC